jgi:isoleucyl-tRNA synthetase
MSKHLKDTVFLPKTDFPMQGNLAVNESSILKAWEESNLFGKIREEAKGREKFILHFGPPYANGHAHIGHALIGILKDAVVKSYQMLGYDAPLVIGWDCHGLPIEWKIEESYLKNGKKREDVPVEEFLLKCREFAEYWTGIQKDEFRRLGIIADFKNPYSTMAKKSESVICKKFFEVVKKGLVYRGRKPVMWSTVEKTALAEAELEYHDKVSDAIFVRYPIIKTKNTKLDGAFPVIWTTTPWTIPGSMAIAYSREFEYVVLQTWSNGHDIEPSVKHNAESVKYIIASKLVETFVKESGIGEYSVIHRINGDELERTVCEHPLKNLGFLHGIPMLQADHVTADAGTGLVHTAPAHGVEDFILGMENGLPVENVVDDDGLMSSKLPHFQGEHVFKVGPKVIESLAGSGNLVHASKITHSYPHSWRSKAPLIFRATSQWFISIDKIRGKLLSEIDGTKWFPDGYINRIRSMVEERPDWCISRQRLWGVPIALFIHKKTDEVLVDNEVFDNIVKEFEESGIESWYTKSASHFLGSRYDPEDYVKVSDTLEVWFDSACTHHFVLEERPELSWPADLYFEGSDQHRGWFQSSLVESVCTNGRAPYRQVATNGFVLDKDGKKMSKSLGNVVSPDDVISKMGADILRLWCLNSDYSEDLRIGEDILKRQQDVYRRFRNTLRYLLGIISCNNLSDRVQYDSMPDLEKVILRQLYGLDVLHKESIRNYNFQRFVSALHAFCANDLSAFYFDIRKDAVYCDGVSDIKRRSCITVMHELFLFITHWLAPILSFTAEEAWLHYPLNSRQDSIHLNLFPKVDEDWNNRDALERGGIMRKVKKSISAAIEIERAAKVIGSSLEADVVVFSNEQERLVQLDLEEIAIVSKATVVASSDEDVKVVVSKAIGQKCERCWKVSRSTQVHPTRFGDAALCARCLDVVRDFD